MHKRLLTNCFFLFCITVYGQEQPSVTELLVKLETAKDSNKVKLLIQIGNYYLVKMRLDSNKFYLTKALKEAENCGFTHGESRVLLGLGYMCMYEGEYDKALEFYQRSLFLKEKLKLPLEGAAVKDAIGRLYKNLKDPERAMKYFLEARSVFELFQDSARLMPLMIEIGTCYEAKNENKQAVENYRTVISVYDNWERNHSSILPLAHLANYQIAAHTIYSNYLLKNGGAAEAVSILESLIKKSKIDGKIQLQNYLGRAYLKTGNYKKAADICEEAISFLNSNPNQKLLDKLTDLYECASDAYYSMGDYKSALNNYKAFKKINDSVFNEKANTAIAEMQTKYETGKKDGQILSLNSEKKSQRIITGLAIGAALIALGFLAFAYRSKKLQQKLFKQKVELLRNEKELEKNILQQKMTELEQMALRAQMNPHFIFNSLNSVQHFVMNHDVEGVNKYLGAFAHLIRQTLNNSGKQLVSLDDEIKYLDTYLALEKMKSNNRFNYKIEAADDINTNTTFIPGMILQPFVENSIKHGVAHKTSDEGLINIRISKNGKLVCRIDDNGIGRQKAGEIKMAANTEYESKGMDITLHRIETINKMYSTSASVQVTDLLDAAGNTSGTSVTVELPFDME